MQTLRRWGWTEWLMLVGLVLSLAAVTFFAVRGLRQVPRRQVDEPIRPWMTVPYIARSYRVPSHVLYAALGLPATPRDRRPLIAIARAQQRPVNELIADLDTAIVHARPPYPTPPPDPTQVRP